MRVAFDPDASDDLDRVLAWIAKDDPHAAYEMIGRIEAKVMSLATPELMQIGHPGVVEGTRELVEYPYIIVYKIDNDSDQIVVISIVHGADPRNPRTADR
jgi:plasmid stabilization system protein ParE